MTTTIYHNPRCSKSRQTLALIEEKGESHQVVEYLKNTPTTDELKQILTLLGLTPRQLMRTKEDLYKTLNLENESLPEDKLIEAMAKNPKLIERPIVVKGDKAIIGRPPENVLSIL